MFILITVYSQVGLTEKQIQRHPGLIWSTRVHPRDPSRKGLYLPPMSVQTQKLLTQGATGNGKAIP